MPVQPSFVHGCMCFVFDQKTAKDLIPTPPAVIHISNTLQTHLLNDASRTNDSNIFCYNVLQIFYLACLFLVVLMSHDCKYDVSHMVTSWERQNSEVSSPYDA